MIRRIAGLEMKLHPDAFIAEDATLVGAVTLEKDANIWYGAVLRGDMGAITIGAQSAVEDQVVIHGEVVLGERVVVGHCALLHGCTIESECLIGMSATVMDGAVIGAGSIVGAGSLVLKGLQVPPGSLVLGSPAKVVGAVTKEQRENIPLSALSYVDLAALQLPRYAQRKD